MAANIKHLRMPDQIRQAYRAVAYQVYDMVTGDFPEVERYSMSTKIEIIQDANRIKTNGQRMGTEFAEWINAHEYDPQYQKDMEDVIRSFAN